MLLVMVLMSMVVKEWWPEKTMYVKMSCMCMNSVLSAAASMGVSVVARGGDEGAAVCVGFFCL
jgi:hypothetical protein